VGLSWDPFGNGKTAISAGFGMFDVLPLPYLIQFNTLFSAPFYQGGNSTSLPAGSFSKRTGLCIRELSRHFSPGIFRS